MAQTYRRGTPWSAWTGRPPRSSSPCRGCRTPTPSGREPPEHSVAA